MPSCPHQHQQKIDIDTNGEAVSFCRESCSKTFFFCSYCGEANRPLARFCRHCSEPLSFADAEAALETSVPIRGQQGESYRLSSYGIKEVYALKSYLGYLLVVADKGVLIFDGHLLHEPIKTFWPQDGRAIRGASGISLPDDERIFVTTAQCLYQFSLIDLDAQPIEIYRTSKPSRFIYHPAFMHVGDLYFLEHDEADQTSSLIRFPDQVVATFKGFTHAPLIVANDRIFFCTETQIFLYNTRDNTLHTQKSPEYLPQTATPAYSRELETVYLVGENNLWRLDLNRPELSPAPLNTKSSGDPHIAASSDQLFVARSSGLAILDPFGEIKWDYTKSFISAVSDGRAPEIYPHYFIFTSIGRMGGSDARVHSRSNPPNFELFSYEQLLSCAPLLHLGRLIAVVGERQSLELKIN